MPSTPSVHHFVEEGADGFGIGAVEERGVSGDAEAAAEGFFDGVDGDVVSTFAADSEIMLFALAVEVHAEGQVFAGLEEIDFFLQQQGVGAEVNVFLAGDQAFDDLADLRVHQRLAAGDGDHGGAAFVDGAEAFFGGEVLLQDVGGVLDLAASGAGQVAAEQRFEHEDQRILLAAGELLAQDIARRRSTFVRQELAWMNSNPLYALFYQGLGAKGARRTGRGNGGSCGLLLLAHV